MRSEKKHGLIFCLPGVGDSLMATPMIRLLKERNPHYEIDIACMFSGVELVFKKNKNIRHIYKVPLYHGSKSESLKKLFELRSNKYDFSILAYPAFRREYHLIQMLVGAQNKIAHSFNSGYFSEFHFLNHSLIPVDMTAHNVENNLNLLKVFDINWKNHQSLKEIHYDFHLEDCAKSTGLRMLSDYFNESIDHLISIHAGSTQSPAALAKRWEPERFFILIDRFLQESKKIMLFFGPDEKDIYPLFLKKYGSHPHVFFVHQQPLEDSLGLLAHSKLLITNDNGFGHFGVVLRIPTLVLYGPTEHKWSAPFSENYSHKITSDPYQPWHKYELKRMAPLTAKESFVGLTPDRVQKKAKEILTASS